MLRKMANPEVPLNGIPQHQIGSGSVASAAQRLSLEQAFVYALDPTHWPMTLKESQNQMREAKKKKKRQQLRAYKALLGRIAGLLRQFPQDQALSDISGRMSTRINQLRDGLAWVAYTAKDGYSWCMCRGVMPAIAPRQLLAVCIAKELWPDRSPYQVVIEQMGYAHEKAEIVNNHIRALEKQVFRVLRHPEEYPVFGGERTTDPYVLLRQELLDFKIWKEHQQERADISIEEFDAHFDEYLNRIHPTPEEEQLLRGLLDRFLRATQSRSRGGNRNKPVCPMSDDTN
jgi:hypothetical protein